MIESEGDKKNTFTKAYNDLCSIMHKLNSNAIETKAFGLKKGTVCGIEIDIELQTYKDIHTVTLYLNPKRQEVYYEYIIGLKPARVIFNPGTENPVFYERLNQAFIRDQATLSKHPQSSVICIFYLF